MGVFDSDINRLIRDIKNDNNIVEYRKNSF